MLSDNTDLIVELWSRIKSHVPHKERIDVAEAIVEVFDEYGMADGLDEVHDLDKEMSIAVKDYFGYTDDDDN